MKTVTTIIALFALAGMAIAQAPAKKILIGAQNLNHLDQMLIEKLKEKGLEIVLVGPTNIDLVGMSKPPSYPVKEGTVKADRLWGSITPEEVKEYSAFFIPRVSSAKGLNLPVVEILQSGKLVVLGEAPGVSVGEKLLRGEEVKSTAYKNAKAFEISGSPDRIAYIVYRSSHDEVKNEDDLSKFVTSKLLPRILQGL